MKRLGRLLFAIVALAGTVASAFGQGALVQGGSVTPGRVPMYVQGGSGAQTIVQDSGPAGGGVQGLGVSEFLMTARGTGTPPYASQGTGPLGTNRCSYDAPTNNANGYHYACDSPNAQGSGLFVYGAGGIAAPLPYCFNINGTASCIGGSSGTGFVTATLPTTTGAVTCWANTTGGLGSCSVGVATLLGNPSGSGSTAAPFTIQGLTARGAPNANNDRLPIWDASSGTIKYVTPGLIASAATAGVSSLGGITGALTLSGGLSMSGLVLGDANAVYASDYLNAAGKSCDGSTDVTTELQAFLTKVSTNAATRGAVTGYFAPGDCRISAQLVLTINSSTLAQNYRLVGYGTTLTPNIALSIGALYIKRGTFLTYGDEQRSTTVEGLTCNAFNNSNAVSCFEIDDRRVTFFRTTVIAGDQGFVHNSGLIGYYWHQSDLTNPDTGPFWGRMIDNFVQGQGPGVSGIPTPIVLQGAVNRFLATGNVVGGGTYGFTLINPCASNTADCGYIADGVVIDGNDLGGLTSGIRITTTVPAHSTVSGLRIINNTVEAMVQSFVEASNIVLNSGYPNTLGPNTFINGSGAVYLNNGSINWSMMDIVTGRATINPASLAAGAVASVSTSVSALGATTDMTCEAKIAGNTQGVVPQCFVSSADTITAQNINPTSGAIDLPSQVYYFRARYPF